MINKKLQDVTRLVAVPAAVTLLNILLAHFTREVRSSSEIAALMFFPAGVTLACMWRLGFGYWRTFFIATFVGEAFFYGNAWLPSLGDSIGNSLEVILAYVLLKKANFVSFRRLRDTFAFVFFGAIFPTLPGKLISLSSLWFLDSSLSHRVPFFNRLAAWWVSDLAGILVMGALLLIWSESRRFDLRVSLRNWPRLLEIAAFIVVTISTTLLVADVFPLGLIDNYMLSYALFGVMTWAALRMGMRGTTLTTFLVSIVCFYATHQGNGILPYSNPDIGFLALQIFLATFTATSLILASAIVEREEANKAKSLFLATMSHEIRTPLGALLGVVRLLRDTADQEQREQYIEVVERNGQLLTNLINEILDINKIESGSMQIEKMPVNFRETVNDVIKMFNVMALQKGLSLKFECSDEIPGLILTDPTRLRQILINLVSNAIKFTDSGSVVIDAQVADGKVTVDVTDTGIGISLRNQVRIFNFFTQSDISTSRRYGGTGLGLTLAKKLAQLLGGDVKLVQSKVGTGSTFRASFAYQAVVVPQEAATVQSNSPNALQGLSILLVEDSPDNQLLFCHVLQRAGAQVTVAHNGQEGVSKALNSNFNIILMDMQMPVLNGLEATSLLRQNGYRKPIIALTANALADSYKASKNSGCDDFVSKPADMNKLVQMILKYTELEKLG